MSIVAGVDFGTLSVRVSIVDSERGLLASAVAEYPLHRKREDPDFATQSHEDHMRALAEATRQAVKSAGISGDQVESIALDTTGSSVIPVGEGMVPLDDYYLWCDHRAKQEAARDHGTRASGQTRGHPMVRRRLLLRMGICQAAALAAPQSRQARQIRSAPSSTATWSPPRCAASPIPPRETQRLRHGTQVDVERLARRPASGRIFWRRSIRCLQAFARNSKASTRHPTKSRERLRRNGRRNSDCARAFRFQSAHSTPTGTRSAQAQKKATSSTSSAPRPASSPMHRRRS